MSDNESIKEDIIQEQILLAAKQLFQVHGLRKVTMDDVAKAIGKARSSLYYYYKSKDEILAAVIEAEIREMLTGIAHATDQVQTSEEKIHAFFITKLQIMREKRSFFNAMETGMNADEMSSYHKAKQEIHQRILQQEGALLSKLLTTGMERGELRAMSAKELKSMVFVLLGSLHGLKREILLTGDFTQIQPAIDTLTQLVIYGLKK